MLQGKTSGIIAAGLAVVAIFVAVVWMHPRIATSDAVYASSDAQAAAAFQRVAERALEAGEFPYWNPFVFMGMPSYASLAHAHGAYPLTGILSWARETFSLPPMNWLVFHLWLGGVFMCGWMRWRGHSWIVAIGAGAWMVALPKLVAWSAYGHGTKVGSFAWLPLALWCAEGVLRRLRWRWAAGLALALTMMLLRAHVQIAYYAVLAIGFLVLAHLVAQWRRGELDRRAWLAVGMIAAAGAVALLSSLSLYLPVWEYQAHSVRGAGSTGGGAAFDYATNWSLSWKEFATQWWPTAAGYGRGSYVGSMPFTDYPNYVGLPLILLAVVGVALRRDRSSWALVALAVFATLVALGQHFPLYRLLYEALPGFKKFRVPVMILALQEIAIIVLAAQGLDGLVRTVGAERRPRWFARPLWVALAAAGVLGILLGTVGASALRETVQSQWIEMARSAGRPTPPMSALAAAAALTVSDALRLGAIALAVALSIAGLLRHRIPAAAVLGLVALLVFVDLWRVDQPLVHPEKHLMNAGAQGGRMVAVPAEPIVREASALAGYTEETEVTRWLKQQEPRPRVLPLGGFEADNRLAAQEIASLGGYHAAKLRAYEDFRSLLYDRNRPRLHLANLFAARWVVVGQELQPPTIEAIRNLGVDLASEPSLRSPDGVVYENRSALPRAYAVGAYELEQPGRDTTAEEPAKEVLQRVAAPSFDARARAILSAEPDPRPEPGAESGAVEVVEERYNGMRVQVDLPVPGVLVLADPWYPAWRATLDGEPARLLRANHVQRAVALPAGRHEVELHYEASSHRLGRWASALGMILILAGLATIPLEHFGAWRTSKPQESA